MKERADLVAGWLKKAESDLLAVEATLHAAALDAACFHAQQAAEKFLKAFLCHTGRDFPHSHNLAKLVELCRRADSSFPDLRSVVEPLTPYAVELRYDQEFWPTQRPPPRQRTKRSGCGTKCLRDFPICSSETAERTGAPMRHRSPAPLLQRYN